MTKQGAQTRMVAAPNVRAWLLWLGEHFDPGVNSAENQEMRRLGRTLEEVGRLAGAIETGEKFGSPTCLLFSFDWEDGLIEFAQPRLLENRLGSPDPDAFIDRLVAITGLVEQAPRRDVEPEYML